MRKIATAPFDGSYFTSKLSFASSVSFKVAVIQYRICFLSYYSLALANHLMGSRLGERGHFMIEQAHQCYALARLTVPTETCSHDVFKLVLSTQNNQMSIYVEFGMHEQSKACLKVLTEMMSSLPQYAEGLDLDHDIVLNVMVLSRTDASAAA
jgi:hypothetical protein